MAKFIEFNTSNGPIKINPELILGYLYSNARKAIIIYMPGEDNHFILECPYEEYQKFDKKIENYELY